MIAVWKRHPQEKLGLQVVAALAEAPGASSLGLSDLESLLDDFPQSVQMAAAELLAERRRATTQRHQRLQAVVELSDGEPERGKQVFFGRSASCVSCHRVEEKGGTIGPDLSTIGKRRSKRDLLEAVLFPNASQARGFESFLMRLDDGRQLAGMVLSESHSVLRVRTTDQREVIVPRSAIQAMKPSEVSVMPAGLERTMSPQQMQDLVAFLQSLGRQAD